MQQDFYAICDRMEVTTSPGLKHHTVVVRKNEWISGSRGRSGRMCRDIDMQQSAARMFDDDKHVEHAEGRRDRNTEVARHHGLSVVAHKRGPALGRHACGWTAVQALRQILAHGAGRHAQTQADQRLEVNRYPLSCAKIGSAHFSGRLADQLTSMLQHFLEEISPGHGSPERGE
jgi:hypothetical protein